MHRNLLLIAVCILFSMIFFMNCRMPEPLGDGTLTGIIPNHWIDSGRHEGDTVLVLNDYTEPLPLEISIRRIEWKESLPKEWVFVKELEIPAPRTPVGEGWIENTRIVRVYHRAFDKNQAFEADIDINLEEFSARRFLKSLSLTSKSN